MVNRVYDSFYERLIANSEKPDDQNECGCWLWTGALGSRGYGKVTVRKPRKVFGVMKLLPRPQHAHRAMAQYLADRDAQYAADDAIDDPFTLAPTVASVPLDPDEQTVDHLCWAKPCINPDHFDSCDRLDNFKRYQNR